MMDEAVSGGRKCWVSTRARSGRHYGHPITFSLRKGWVPRPRGALPLAQTGRDKWELHGFSPLWLPLASQSSLNFTFEVPIIRALPFCPHFSVRDVLQPCQTGPFLRRCHVSGFPPSLRPFIHQCSGSIICIRVTSTSNSVPPSKKHRACRHCTSRPLFPMFPRRPWKALPLLRLWPSHSGHPLWKASRILPTLFCLEMWLFTPLASPLPESELLQSSVCLFYPCNPGTQPSSWHTVGAQ